MLCTVPVTSNQLETLTSPQATPGALLDIQIPITSTKNHVKMAHVWVILGNQMPLPPGDTWQKMSTFLPPLTATSIQ